MAGWPKNTGAPFAVSTGGDGASTQPACIGRGGELSSSFQPCIRAMAPKCSARALSPRSIQVRESVAIARGSPS
jgi:hypothetical protein